MAVLLPVLDDHENAMIFMVCGMGKILLFFLSPFRKGTWSSSAGEAEPACACLTAVRVGRGRGIYGVKHF